MARASEIIEGEQIDDFPIFPTAIPDRPFSITSHPYGKCLTPHGPWTALCTDAFDKYNVRGINLNLWAGWEREKLDFLAGLSGAVAVHVFTGSKEDLTPLNTINEGLEILALQCRPANTFDMLGFPHLRRFRCNGDSKITNLEEASQLEEVAIRGGPKYSSFDRFRRLKALRSLTQTNGGIEELGFTFKRPVMRELEVSYCYKIASLDGLGEVPNLKRLEIVAARRIPSIDAVAQLKELEWLVLDGCGTYESLDPILELRNLHFLSLGQSTRIMDPNVLRLLELPNLKVASFQPRRHHHNAEVETLRKELGKRRDAVGRRWQHRLKLSWRAD